MATTRRLKEAGRRVTSEGRLAVELEFHEAANIFPLNEADVDAIAADIKANGQRVAIELLDGKIIDGRTRYKACLKIGAVPKTIKLDRVPNDDPIAYVKSLNFYRRHLSFVEKADIAVKARDVYDAAAKERQKLSEGRGMKKGVVSGPQVNTGKSREQVGELFEISGATVDRMTRVVKRGVPELVEAVRAEEISIADGAKISSLPEEEQREEVAKAKEKTTSTDPCSPRDEPASQDRPAYNESRSRGKGVQLAHEAIAVLKRIPHKDPLALDGLTIVMNWIKHNKHSYGCGNV